jgi:hypothetical protein
MEAEKKGSRGFIKKEIREIRRNILIFAFFLFLSFVFWYLNSLGKVLEADISYPVRYISLPRGMEFTEKLPEKLSVNLVGPGYSIFKLKYSGNRTPAIIDLSKTGYRRSRANPDYTYYMVTNGLIKTFASQLKTECKISAIRPDTLFFSFKKASD